MDLLSGFSNLITNICASTLAKPIKNSGLPKVKTNPRAEESSKTYSTKDSRVVTHRSTNLAIRSLTMGERTGSRIFFNLWPYVTVKPV